MSTAVFLISASLALAACSTTDGYGYGSYYGGSYGAYGSGPNYGWYDDYYYPGNGYYVYDRGGTRHRWNQNQRRYWESRGATIMAIGGIAGAAREGFAAITGTIGRMCVQNGAIPTRKPVANAITVATRAGGAGTGRTMTAAAIGKTGKRLRGRGKRRGRFALFVGLLPAAR